MVMKRKGVRHSVENALQCNEHEWMFPRSMAFVPTIAGGKVLLVGGYFATHAHTTFSHTGPESPAS